MKQEKEYFKLNKYIFIHVVSMSLSLIALEVLAADWTSINKTKEYEMLVDIDSYNESEGYPYITTKTIFKKLQNYHSKQNAFTYLENHSTTQFNCALHISRNTMSRFYDQKNNLTGSEKVINEFKPVAMGSTNASLEGLVCQVHKMVGGQ